MRIAIIGAEKWEVPLFKRALGKHSVVFPQGNIKTILSELKGIEVLSLFVLSGIDTEILAKLPKLKLIATRSTGFDHIDIRACEKRKVIVCNVPAYGDNTVAEHTFALILAVTRKFVPAVERTRRGNFSLDGLRGVDLKGKTIGVVGTGKIGRNVIRIAKGFLMNVVAYDAFPDKNYAQAADFHYVSFDELLDTSDIISLHCPLTEHTRHMLNIKNIAKIKKGAILINTARGAIVETKALVQALQKGILSGAGIDVLEEECTLSEETELLTSDFAKRCDVEVLLAEHVLIEMDNVVITPHNAFNSEEAVHRITQTTIENILAFIKGKPQNTVRFVKP